MLKGAIVRRSTARRLGFYGLLLAISALLLLLGCEKEKKTTKRPPRPQGNGVEKTVTRPIGEFERVRASSRLRVEVTIGEARPMEIVGDENLLSHVTVKNEKGLLVLGTDVKLRPKLPLAVKLSTPKLLGASSMTASRITVTGLRAESFEGSAAGASRLTLNGSVEKLTLKASLRGQLDLSDLAAQSALVRLDGRARARMGYLEELNVTLLDSARLAYRGDPRITQDIQKTARVYRVD